MLRLGKIPSHKRFQFVCVPSWHLISRHNVLVYLHSQSGSHKALAQKIRHSFLGSDEPLFVPLSERWIAAIRAACPTEGISAKGKALHSIFPERRAQREHIAAAEDPDLRCLLITVP